MWGDLAVGMLAEDVGPDWQAKQGYCILQDLVSCPFEAAALPCLMYSTIPEHEW